MLMGMLALVKLGLGKNMRCSEQRIVPSITKACQIQRPISLRHLYTESEYGFITARLAQASADPREQEKQETWIKGVSSVAKWLRI